MNTKPLLIVTCALLLAACGGGGDGGANPPPATNPPPPPPPAGTIGPAGGTVTGPNGAQVLIPANALARNTVVVIEQSSAGAPPLPNNLNIVGSMYAFLPHGTTFTQPATMTVPFDPSLVPPNSQVRLYKTNAGQSGWEEVAGTTVNGSTISGAVGGFSHAAAVVLPPLDVVGEPKRYFQLALKNFAKQKVLIAGNINVAGQIGDPLPPGNFSHSEDFGELPFIPPGRDMWANGAVYSSADGRTYWAEAESPLLDLNTAADDNYPETLSWLVQYQSYRKHAANATLVLHVTQARLQVADFNSGGHRYEICRFVFANGNLPDDCNDKLHARLKFHVRVGMQAPGQPAGTFATFDNIYSKTTYSWAVDGTTVLENLQMSTEPARPAWGIGRFVRTDSGGMREMNLEHPLAIPIDLSNVPECRDPAIPAECPEFTIRASIEAITLNRRAGETYALARFRDPVGVGGLSIETTGLTPTNNPLMGPILPMPSPPCTNPGTAETGALRFGATSYRQLENGDIASPITVERVGGSSGTVIATLATEDGTARAGVDFTPIALTIVFREGDSLPKEVELPTIDNNDNENNRALSLRLIAPAGCAPLGNPATAEVIIVDDEARPAPSSPSGTLDTSFGTGGKVTTAPFGGTESRMVRQPDGKYVIVGGSFVDFVIARFNNDGTPDNTFGAGGRVTTNIQGGSNQERARAVAIQPDGKIVVAGESSPDFRTNYVTLARYNANGSLDADFGTDGVVFTGTVTGRAWAVTVQADGKIVVAGDQYVDNRQGDFGDILVARYQADGRLDTGFAIGGSRAFDMTNATDQARNVLVQPDGKIVISGVPIENNGNEPTIVVRFENDGRFDETFGTDGMVLISTARIGHGLAQQSDGQLLLAGTTMGFPGSFALMRLNTNGSADTSFGNAGAVTTSITNSTSGLGDRATSVVVRPDGRIYVAGIADSINYDFGLARFTSNGVLDGTFAGTGSMTVDFNGQVDGAESIALENDGRIVLGGYATPSSSDGYGLVRIHP